MKRTFWLLAALFGIVAITAACDPFATAGPNDYVVFDVCPTTTCAPGESNTMVMKSPTETVVNGTTTLEGPLQLRLTGRDGAEHDYALQGTIVEDGSDASLSATTPAALAAQWDDTLGIDGLDLTDATLTGEQNGAGQWQVRVKATPQIQAGSPAENLLPPLAPGVNTFSTEVSNPDVPVTAGVRLGQLTLGEYHFDSLDLTKTSWPGHAHIDASVTGASATLGGVPISNVDAQIGFDATFHGHVHVTGDVGMGNTTVPVAVDLPVHLSGGDIVAGPDASIHVGPPSGGISLSGTYTVSGVLGGAPLGVALSDGTLTYGTTQIPVSGSFLDGPDGFSAHLHAGTAQLTPGVLLHDADLDWASGTLGVHAAADLSGNLTAHQVTVDGSATITGGTPALDLTLAAESVDFGLSGDGEAPRTVHLDGVSLHLGGNFTGGTVAFDAALGLDNGTVGNTTIGGNLALSGTIALGDSLSVKGWAFDLDTTVNIDAIEANATIHGSGGTLYDGTHGGIGCVSVPIGAGQMAPTAAPATRGCDAAEVTGRFDIVDTGNGIGGVLRADVWFDTAGKVHLSAAGNAHLTIGSKVAVDGAVQISDNVIYVNGNLKFGTKLTAPVFGTVTLDPNDLTAVPAVDLAVGKTYLTKKLWLDNVHVTNTADLTHFDLTGEIANAYGAKTLGLISISKRFGALKVDGSVDLGGSNLTNPDTTNVSYDLSITAPNATNSSPLLWLFYSNTNNFDFHVWGDSHTAHMSLDAGATLFAGLRPLGAGANVQVDASGTVNLDSGAVNVSGSAEADAFVNLGVVADGTATANVGISLTGNINSSVSLSANGTGEFSANALGFLPVGSGDGQLNGNVSISMADGSISGTASFHYSVNIVGGVFGNTDGDWYYDLSGSTSQPVVTAHDSYSRHNHYRGVNISGQVYPVKNLCGQQQHKGTFQFNWHDDGQWGDCAGTGTVEGRVLVDTDGSQGLSGADAPLPAGSQVAVTVTDASDGGSLVGQGVTAADGTFSASVVTRPGHTYSVALSVPSGYAYDPGTSGYQPSGGASVAAPGSGQTRNVGTFGVAERHYGSVTGVVFDDANHNGTQDAGEVGIPGVALTIDGRPAISGPGGHYDMNLLEAGHTVTVALTAPSGWSVTADPDGVMDGTTQVVVQAGAATTVGGFGLCQGATCHEVVAAPLPTRVDPMSGTGGSSGTPTDGGSGGPVALEQSRPEPAPVG